MQYINLFYMVYDATLKTCIQNTFVVFKPYNYTVKSVCLIKYLICFARYKEYDDEYFKEPDNRFECRAGNISLNTRTLSLTCLRFFFFHPACTSIF